MKNSILIALLSLGLIACNENASSKIDSSKQKIRTQVTLDQVDTPSDAKMEFEATEWNFGEITQGESVEYAFEFTNTGSEPLIITNAKGSCGCTVPVWPREPVAPGESGVVDVKFNSKGKKGKQNKKVTLTTNMVPSQMVLKVTGLVNLKEE
ncbi:MAG: DUF1573 domain-containing protein [Flavobacteriales bacterium]|mgnify:FL=1|jgi:hypothetical protein|tara:strand:+ start:1213 stop:1668 length:456 start_codon:yes stop_codon:yes gene_type:complete